MDADSRVCNILAQMSGRDVCDMINQDEVRECSIIDDVIKSANSVAVIYTQPDCPYCIQEMMAVESVKGKYPISILNVNVRTCRPAESIKGTPTMDIYVHGEKIDSILGAKTTEQIDALFREVTKFEQETR